MALSDTKSGLYLCKIFMRGLRVAASSRRGTLRQSGNQPVWTDRADLVLSGVMMPDKNGIEVASELREKFPHCKILLFSGSATAARFACQGACVWLRLGDIGQTCPSQGPVGLGL